jgi:hypothetical protein
MNIPTESKKGLVPVNMEIFKRYISDKTKDNEISKKFAKFNNFLDLQEKNVEILNNAFSQYGPNHLIENNPRIKATRRQTKRPSVNYTLFKPINTDINDSNKGIKIKILKNSKLKRKNEINIRLNNDINQPFYNNLFNSTDNFNNFPEMTESKKDLVFAKNKINTISSKLLNADIKNKNIINNIINQRNNNYIIEKLNLKTSYILNKTDGLFNRSKKILNFMEFYNINTTKSRKELEKESKVINMKSISYKTLNSIYKKNNNKNKLFYDIKQIKDINNNIVNCIEKSEIKLIKKNKTFQKRYKKNEVKFFGNEDLKLMKNNKKKGKSNKKDIFRNSVKEIYIPRKIFGKIKIKTLSEEIKLRKQKEKKFYDTIDNIILNNDLFVYDINKIDKRLKMKRDKELINS